MTTDPRPYDIDGAEGTERPHAEFTDWQARPSAGAWLDVIGIALGAVIVAVLVVTAMLIGWPRP